MEDDGSRSRLASASAAASRVARGEAPSPLDRADDDDDASVASTSRRRRRFDSSSSGTSRFDPTLGRCARARTARRARGGPARRAAPGAGARRWRGALASRVALLRGVHLAPEVLAAAAALARASNAPMANIARVVCADGRRIARGWWSASRRARRGGHVRRLSRFRTATDEIFLRRVGTARRRGRISRRRTCASDQQRRAAIEIDRDRSSSGEHDVRARAGKCPRPSRVPSG